MHRTHSDRRPTRPPAYLPGGSRGARCGWPESAGRWLVVMGFGGWIEWDESVDACIQCGHGRTPPQLVSCACGPHAGIHRSCPRTLARLPAVQQGRIAEQHPRRAAEGQPGGQEEGVGAGAARSQHVDGEGGWHQSATWGGSPVTATRLLGPVGIGLRGLC